MCLVFCRIPHLSKKLYNFGSFKVMRYMSRAAAPLLLLLLLLLSTVLCACTVMISLVVVIT